MTRYLVLISLWGAWCFLHSLMITQAVTHIVRKRFEKAYRYYRIVYNVTASATLIPVLIYTFSIKEVPVFRWEGPFRVVQGLFLVAALLLFVAGARRYSLAQFLGIRQVHEDNTCSVLTDECRLDTGGILAMVRHPWYTGGMLIIWARNLDITAILTNLVVTGYFLIGIFLEEKRLVAEFGVEYIDYQKRVSMLFPFKWVIKKFVGTQY